MPTSYHLQDLVLQFTLSLDGYKVAAFTLIAVLAMMCWTVNSTDSKHRADLVRAFTGLIRALTGLIRALFDGVKSLLTWGNPGEEPPGLTA